MTKVFTNAPSQVASWRKVTVPYTTLQTAAITNNVAVMTLAAREVVHYALFRVTTAFSGTTTLTLSLGITGSVAKYVTAQTALSTSVLNGVSLSTPVVESASATTNLNLDAIATVQNLSSLSQGSIDIFVLTSILP